MSEGLTEVKKHSFPTSFVLEWNQKTLLHFETFHKDKSEPHKNR